MSESRRNIPTGTTVVDVDAHYTGQFETLVKYIDPGPDRERFADAVKDINKGEYSVSKGFWPKTTSQDEVFRRGGFWEGTQEEVLKEGYVDGGKAEILAVMDRLGIDKIIFLGNYANNFDLIRGDDKRPTVYANAYIDYLLDQVVDPDEGIYAGFPIPYQDPDEAVELIDRVGNEKGVAAACFVSSNPEPPLGNRRYDPIYQALEDAGLPAIYHGGTVGVDNYHISGYSTNLETHHLGFLWANVSQLTSVIVQGIPEKFPGIDFVWQETGIFWIPMMMYRLDSEYFHKLSQAPLLEKRPSEYMKEMYFGTQPLDEPPKPHYFEYVLEMIGGADRLMYASDWPHGDWDDASVISNMNFLSDEEKVKILGKNAEEVFGI